jgi:hypothetical protein
MKQNSNQRYFVGITGFHLKINMEKKTPKQLMYFNVISRFEL